MHNVLSQNDNYTLQPIIICIDVVYIASMHVQCISIRSFTGAFIYVITASAAYSSKLGKLVLETLDTYCLDFNLQNILTCYLLIEANNSRGDFGAVGN